MDPFDLFTYGVIVILSGYGIYIIIKIGKHLRFRKKANDPEAAAYARVLLNPDGPSMASQAMLENARKELLKK